jgi:hypothetical protein
MHEVLRLFIEHRMSAAQIAESPLGKKHSISREGVYPILQEALSLGLMQLRPPISLLLSSKIAKCFNVAKQRIHVVDVLSPNEYDDELRLKEPRLFGRDSGHPGKAVSAVAADRVFELVLQRGQDLWARQNPEPVCIGLGPGRATLDVSHALAERIRTSDKKILARLITISGGGPARFPQFSPSSYFNVFPDHIANNAIGIFASPLVTEQTFQEMIRNPGPGFAEAWAEKHKISVVMTSMGDMNDPHDLLREHMEAYSINVNKLVSEHGWLGNVQYRPFSVNGWIHQAPDDRRVPTLFELEEFVGFRTTNKHVILIARQCSVCYKDRGEVLYPLMRNENMRVWSEIVMDAETARGLLAKHKQLTGIEISDAEAMAE